MENEQLLTLLFLGGGTMLLALAVNQMMRPDKVRVRVARLASQGGLLDEDELREPAFSKMARAVLRLLGVKPDEAAKDLSQRFDRAGIVSPFAHIYYQFYQRVLRYFVAAAGLGVLWHWMGLAEPAKTDTLTHFMVAGGLLFIAWKGADMYISNCREKRSKVLQKSFPEALDLLLVCVEAGLALDSALSRVCRELRDSHPEITSELDRTRLELTVLNNRVEALHNLAERTNLLGFKSLVSALVQSEKFGTSLADTLRVLSEEYRNNRLMAAENRAARVPVLITIPMIMFILPAFLLVVMGSPYISIKQQSGIFSDGR